MAELRFATTTGMMGRFWPADIDGTLAAVSFVGR